MAYHIFIKTDKLAAIPTTRNSIPDGILFELTDDFRQSVLTLAKTAAIGVSHGLDHIRTKQLNSNAWITATLDKHYLPDYCIITGSATPLSPYAPIPHLTQLPTPTYTCIDDTHFWIEGNFSESSGLTNIIKTVLVPLSFL